MLMNLRFLSNGSRCLLADFCLSIQAITPRVYTSKHVKFFSKHLYGSGLACSGLWRYKKTHRKQRCRINNAYVEQVVVDCD